MKNLISKLLKRDKNWYKPKIVWVNGHEFFNVGERLQCVYCLYVQPSVVHDFDRNIKGRVIKITIEPLEEGHQGDCKYNQVEKPKVNWYHYFFPSAKL